MKNKKIITIFIILLIIIAIVGYFVIKYVREKYQGEDIQEYTPEEEITNEQMRQTIVSLYFLDSQTNEIAPEARMIDIKEILEKPYEKLVTLLIEGPKNERLAKIIPEGTKLLGVSLEKNNLTINFSSEFLNYDSNAPTTKANLINSIVNTMTELTEVNSVKFLIDGKENEEFKDNYVRNTIDS